MNIWEIDARIAQIIDRDDDEEYTDQETGEIMTIAQALEQLEMARDAKIEGVALGAKNLKAVIEKIEAAEDDLKDRRAAAERKLAKCKDYLMHALTREDGETEKFKSALTTVFVKRNNPSVIIDDEDALPKEFMREVLVVTPNKSEIKEVISRGIEVPGAHLEQSRSVMIK